MASAVVEIVTDPTEYAPQNDRDAYLLAVNRPEGTINTHRRTDTVELDSRLPRYVESGEVGRLLVPVVRAVGAETTNTGIAINVLAHWRQRWLTWDVMAGYRQAVGKVQVCEVGRRNCCLTPICGLNGLIMCRPESA